MKLKMKYLSILVIAGMLLASCSSITPAVQSAQPTATAEVQTADKNTPDASEAPVATESVTEATQVQAATPETQSSSEAPDILSQLQDAYSQIYEDVVQSVVHIAVTQTTTANTSLDIPNIPGFQFNFPNSENNQREYKTSAVGSGFVWDKSGNIVTNNHVVENADSITVTFFDGTSVKANVVGTDPDSDLAVIKVDVDASRLKPVTVADSTQVKVGNIAIAIGNPFGLEETMTTGTISALGRSLTLDNSNNTMSSTSPSYTIPDIIQTDAAINPGNSGGVLVNIEGQLIGVTAAIESTNGSNAGVGFVIPSIIVKNVVPELIQNGKYEHTWIGISGTTITSEIAKTMKLPEDQHGALVMDVMPNSPAKEAGIKGSDRQTDIDGETVRIGGDVIIKIDNQEIKDFEDITAYLARYTKVGQVVKLTVLRNGKEQTLDLTLAARSSSSSNTEENTTTEAKSDSGAWLGIIGITVNSDLADAMNISKDQKGVLVEQIVQNSPADKAGLNGSYESTAINGQDVMIGGDVITKIDDTSIEDINQMKDVLNQYKPGDEITLTILRNEKEMQIKLTLEQKPS